MPRKLVEKVAGDIESLLAKKVRALKVRRWACLLILCLICGVERRVMLARHYDLSFKVISVVVWPFLGTASCSYTGSYGVCLACKGLMYHVRIYYRYLLAFYFLPPSCEHLKVLPQEYK